MSQRCYLPLSIEDFKGVVNTKHIPEGQARAVTPWLRREWPDGREEDWEYAALADAAADASLLGEPRRVVLVLEGKPVESSQDSTKVQLGVSDFSDLRAIQADPAPLDHVDVADPRVEELGWYATQEAAALLESLLST